MRCWDLSTAEVDVLVEVLRLPSMPYPLDLPSPGVTYEERDRHVEKVLADVAARGHTVEDLAGPLGLLATGQIVIDGRLSLRRQVDLVAVVRGDQAVVAVQGGDAVRINFGGAREVMPGIADMLPEVPKLPGQPISVPYQDFSHALETYSQTGDSMEFQRILADASVDDHDRRTLLGLVRAEAVAAQFGVARRAAATDDYQNRRVWTWYSTSSGGAVLTHDSLVAPQWTTLTPADPAWLGRQLSDAVHALKYQNS